MESSTRGSIEMTVAMTVLGTIGWFVVNAHLPVIAVVFWRCVFAAVALLVACGALGMLRGHLTLGKLGLAVVGGIAIVLNWILLFGAFSRASISMATAVYNTQPFILVGLGALLFSERLTVHKFAWLALAFIGMLLVIDVGFSATGASREYLLGILMALGAAVFWAIAALTAKKLTGTPPHLVALIHVAVGVLMLAPFQDRSSIPTGFQSWGVVVVVGVLHTGLVYILMYSAIQRLSTARQGALSFVYPVVAALVDVVAFHQHFSLGQIAGAIAIVTAAAGMTLGWSLPGMARFARRRADVR